MEFKGKSLLSFVPACLQQTIAEARGRSLKFGHKYSNENVVAILDLSGEHTPILPFALTPHCIGIRAQILFYISISNWYY